MIEALVLAPPDATLGLPRSGWPRRRGERARGPPDGDRQVEVAVAA